MNLTDTEFHELLARAPVGRLATVDGAGRPHIVPVVFAQVGEALYTPIDGKPKRARQLKRVRNIEINSQAALLIDHYADDWRKLWWLRIDVTATAITEDATSPAEFTAALAALTRKYPQYRSTPLLRSDRMLLRMKVMNRVAWSASIDASL